MTLQHKHEKRTLSGNIKLIVLSSKQGAKDCQRFALEPPVSKTRTNGRCIV